MRTHAIWIVNLVSYCCCEIVCGNYFARNNCIRRQFHQNDDSDKIIIEKPIPTEIFRSHCDSPDWTLKIKLPVVRPSEHGRIADKRLFSVKSNIMRVNLVSLCQLYMCQDWPPATPLQRQLIQSSRFPTLLARIRAHCRCCRRRAYHRHTYDGRIKRTIRLNTPYVHRSTHHPPKEQKSMTWIVVCESYTKNRCMFV